jgi:hypothetical protein
MPSSSTNATVRTAEPGESGFSGSVEIDAPHDRELGRGEIFRLRPGRYRIFAARHQLFIPGRA